MANPSGLVIRECVAADVPTPSTGKVHLFFDDADGQPKFKDDTGTVNTFPSAPPVTRNLTAGNGLVGGGDLSADRTFAVGANADGSITVNADDIQVGVLATDGQHGSRGGGSQHALAVANGAAGFLSGADKDKLDQLSPGSSGPFLEEQFITSNLTNDTIGKLGWRSTGNGTGNAIGVSSVPGHPGVLSINPGTVAVAGRRALHLGQSTAPGGFALSTDGSMEGTLEVEWLIRVRNTVGAATLEMFQLGLVAPADITTNGLVQDGLCVQFDPAASGTFRVSTTVGGVQSVQNGTTTVAVNTWYRVSVVFTDTGSGGSAQLKVNGVAEGSPVATNFPTTALGLFAKIDGMGAGGSDPILDIDRVRVFCTQNEET